jgi:SAM-dependent methyltransferase
MCDASINYDQHAPAYPRHRKADPRIAARVHSALGDARTVLNVGAGSGSYEPDDRYVLAVEPSAGMRAQRPVHLAPAISASAEALPLDDETFDAAMAIITLHHWRDPAAGLRELRRIACGPVVVLTFDIDVLAGYWMISDYLPEALADDRERFPTIDAITDILGNARVEPIPIPADCEDGFSRLTTRDRRHIWTPPCGPLSPFGRVYPRASNNAPSRRPPPTSPRARGTRATATCAHSPPTKAVCVSS